MLSNKKVVSAIMRNTLGTAVKEEDFYPREKEMQQIYRHLDDLNNVYLSAPRRVGKTSIMLEVEAAPRKGYIPIYGIYQSCQSAQEFYHRMCKTLLSSPRIEKLSAKITKGIQEFKGMIEGASFEVPGMKAAVTGPKKDWSEEFLKLLKLINIGDNRLVIMVDEFPEVVEQVIRSEGPQAARNFLLRDAEIRTHDVIRKKVLFIYTGSISLVNTVTKTGDTKVVKDLRAVEVGPLSVTEAVDMSARILKFYKYSVQRSVLSHLVGKFDWRIPYHIKLAIEKLRDIPNEQIDTLKEKDVDAAFDAVCQMDDPIEFKHYFGRIDIAFDEKDRTLAHELLYQLSVNPALSYAQAFDHAVRLKCQDNLDRILDALVADGYFAREDNLYKFRSFILKSWWHTYGKRKIR